MGTTAGGANFVGRRGCRGRGEAATGPDYHGDLLFTREVVTQTVKDLPAMWEMCVRSPGREEEPLEEGMATAPVHLPEESPRTGEAGGLQSTGSQRVGCAERTEQSEAGAGLGLVTSHCPVSHPGLLAVRQADGAGTRSPRTHPGGAGRAHPKPEKGEEVQGSWRRRVVRGTRWLCQGFANYQPHERREEQV